MPQKPVPLLAVVLRNLRVRAGWTQVRLEREARLSKGSACRLEKGDQAVDRFLLGRLANVMGIAVGDVERAIAVLVQLPAEAPTGAFSEESQRDAETIETVSSRLSRNVREKARNRIEVKVRARRWQIDRTEASLAWQRLRKMNSDDRKAMVEEVAAFHTWAVVERLCEESARAAANDVEEAQEFAQLARRAASAMNGPGNWRSWLEGYAAAFEGNAWRVAGDHKHALHVFSEANTLRNGQAPEPQVPVDLSRPLILQAALFADQKQLGSALTLLDEALSLALAPLGKTRLLIYRADVLKRRHEYAEALKALAEARRFAQVSGDDRLCWTIAFNEATYLCEAGEATDAASRLGALQTAALELGGTLDNLRLLWLTGRVAAGTGRLAEASSILRKVWAAFADRRIWVDAGLAVLEFACIELEQGESREIKEIATAAAHIFAAQSLPDELLASIRLFWDAARREEASNLAAQQLLVEFRQAVAQTPKVL